MIKIIFEQGTAHMSNTKIITYACGYCGLPAVDTRDGRTIHGDGTPDVPAITPGDYVTGSHRPGTRVMSYDLVEVEPEPGTPCGYSAACPNEATMIIDMAPVNPALPVCQSCADLYARLSA